MKKDKKKEFVLIIFIIIIIIICVGGIYLKMSFDNKQQNTCLETCPEGYELKNKNSPNCYCKEKPKPINEIVISMDNWQEYFEIKKIDIWDKDDFGDVNGLAIQNIIKLKDAYHDKIAKKSEIKFKVFGKERSRELTVNYKNQTYQLRKIDIYKIDKDYETTTTFSLNEYSSTQDFSEQIYWCHDGYYEMNGKKYMDIHVLEDYNVTRVEGRLYLYK